MGNNHGVVSQRVDFFNHGIDVIIGVQAVHLFDITDAELTGKYFSGLLRTRFATMVDPGNLSVGLFQVFRHPGDLFLADIRQGSVTVNGFVDRRPMLCKIEFHGLCWHRPITVWQQNCADWGPIPEKHEIGVVIPSTRELIRRTMDLLQTWKI